MEGAGSPAETNLRTGDLANFGFAQAMQIPAVLVGDIHRGGVIASIVGTHMVLDAADRNLLKAFLINKFHGDPHLFDEGRDDIIRRTGLECLGVVPHFAGARHLPAEDAVALEDMARGFGTSGLKVAVLRLPRIANFDDLDPLRAEPNVSLAFITAGEALPGDTDLVIIPGSKSTISDLAALRRTAGTSTSPRTTAAADASSACAAATRCSDAASTTRKDSRARRRPSMVSACSTSRRRSFPTRR